MRDRRQYGRRMLGNVPMPGRPLTEILGMNHVLIENHKGISSYDSNCICVKTSLGIITVEGTTLRIDCISKDNLIIIGQIYCIRFLREVEHKCAIRSK